MPRVKSDLYKMLVASYRAGQINDAEMVTMSCSVEFIGHLLSGEYWGEWAKSAAIEFQRRYGTFAAEGVVNLLKES